jgi:hypothetical protein
MSTSARGSDSATPSASKRGVGGGVTTTTARKLAAAPLTSARGAADALARLTPTSSSEAAVLDVLSALPRSALDGRDGGDGGGNSNSNNNGPRQRARLVVQAARLLARPPRPPPGGNRDDDRKRRRREQALLGRGRDPLALPHRALEACVQGLERELLLATTTPPPPLLPSRERRALLTALLSLYPRPAAGGASPLACRHPRLALWLLRGAAAAAVLDARRRRAGEEPAGAAASSPLLSALRQACALGVRDARSLRALERALCLQCADEADALADALGLFARLALVPQRMLLLLLLLQRQQPPTTLRAAARLAWGAAVCGCLAAEEDDAVVESAWAVGWQALRTAGEMEAAAGAAAAPAADASTLTAARAQLHHARLLLMAREVSLGDVDAITARAWSDESALSARPATPTATQRRAHSALSAAAALGAEAVRLEHPVGPADSGVRVDVAVFMLPGDKVAVEVDGPAHFVLEDEEEEDGEEGRGAAAAASASTAPAPPPLLRWREREDGATVARTWLLRRWGWQVVRVKVREVDVGGVDGDSGAQEEEEGEEDGSGGDDNRALGAALLARVVSAADRGDRE